MTFVKGVSGNPSGKRKSAQKGNKTITQLAREASEDAMKTLVAVMKSDQSTMTAKAIAADKILDRAYGKAPQAVALFGNVAIRKASELSDDELASIIRGAAPALAADHNRLIELSADDVTEVATDSEQPKAE